VQRTSGTVVAMRPVVEHLWAGALQWATAGTDIGAAWDIGPMLSE
jgi:hypothetical protein